MHLSTQVRPELLTVSQENVEFFSNAYKNERELWIFSHWCTLKGQNVSQASKGEAPDFSLNNEKYEIVEVIQFSRKRHKEFKDKLATVRSGVSQPSALFREGPDIKTIKSNAYKWVIAAVRHKQNHYGPPSASWNLMMYLDFAFIDSNDWQTIHRDLFRAPPGFARIEVLFADGGNAKTIYP